MLATNKLQLASGEITPLSVWGINEEGAKISLVASSIECVALDAGVFGADGGVIKLFSSCQIAALSPGKSRIQVHYNSAFELTLLSEIVDVEVVPQLLSTVNGTVAILMNDWQEELWLSVSQLSFDGFYRATLQPIVGRLPFRTAIEVMPDFSDINKACRNTLPADAVKVACYFYSQNNSVTIVIKNASKVQFQVLLLIQSAQDKAQYSVSYSPLTAKPVFPGSVENHYVFANEIGQNNTNFFRLKQNTKPARPLKITLFDYAFPVWLNASWGKKVCTKAMMTFSATQISCTILTDDAADVLIAVDGNNQIELINAPAAAEGGTTYSLLVEYL